MNELRNILPLGMGKLPPQAVDLEEGLLGAVMNNKNALLEVVQTMKPEFFYKDANQKIFKAIQELFTASQPVDVLTVTAQLRKNGELEMVGGSYQLMQLVDANLNINVGFYSRIIEEKAMGRAIIQIASDGIQQGYDDTTDIVQLVEKMQTSLYELVQNNYGREISEMGDLVMSRLLKYEEPVSNGLTGVGTGFTALDRITSGFQPSDLIIIAARPAMGKTAFSLNLAKNAALKYQAPVAVFSLEMSEEQLTDRMISSETGIQLDRLLKRNFYSGELEALHTGVKDLSSAPIFIDDTPSLSINGLRAKAIRLKSLHGLKMIVIDYLQLMSGNNGKNGNREQEISTISRGLKALAKELDIPVVALSQLSRQVENRAGAGKRPMLSDLRESGAIEQDADMVMFLYRPEYYGITEDEEGRSTIGIAEVIIGKNRNGVCDTIPLDFNGSVMRFRDLEDKFYENKPSVIQPNADFNKASNFILKPSKLFEQDTPPF